MKRLYVKVPIQTDGPGDEYCSDECTGQGAERGFCKFFLMDNGDERALEASDDGDWYRCRRCVNECMRD